MKIDTKLKRVRKKTGLTQVDVAERAHTSIRNYQYYEAGKCIPNVYTGQLIAEALDTTVEEIFPLTTVIGRGKKPKNLAEKNTHQNDTTKGGKPQD